MSINGFTTNQSNELRANEDEMKKMKEEFPETPDFIRQMISKEVNLHMNEKHTKGRKFFRSLSKKAIAACAAIAVVASGTAVYAAMNWNTGILWQMNANEEQVELLENSNALQFLDLSETQDGVTVAVDQCIVGKRSLRIGFKVSGHNFEESENPNVIISPSMSLTNFSIGDDELIPQKDDPRINISWGGGYGFDSNGRTPLKGYGETEYTDDNKDSVIQEDGTLLYVIGFSFDEDDYLANKPIKIKLGRYGIEKGLGAGRTFEPVTSKGFEFEWTLPDTVSTTTKTLAQPIAIGNTGFDIIDVEMSPVDLSFTYQENEQYGAALEKYTPYFYESAEYYNLIIRPMDKPENYYNPEFLGVRLKDGTSLFRMEGSGTPKSPLGNGLYKQTIDNLRTVLDVDQVESLIFCKHPADVYKIGAALTDEEYFAEENLVYIPIE